MRKRLILGTALALPLVLSACTKTAETVTAEAPSAGAGAATTAAAKMASKADFITKADAICATYDDKLKALAEPTTSDELLPYFEKALPIGKAQQKELVALGDPPEDVSLWKKGLAQHQDIIDRLEKLLADPNATADSIMNDTKIDSMSKESKADGKKFGLKVCAKDSGSGSGPSTTARPKPTTTTTTTTTTATDSSLVSPADFKAALIRAGVSAAVAQCVIDELRAKGVALKADSELTESELAAHRAAGAKCARMELNGEI